MISPPLYRCQKIVELLKFQSTTPLFAALSMTVSMVQQFIDHDGAPQNFEVVAHVVVVVPLMIIVAIVAALTIVSVIAMPRVEVPVVMMAAVMMTFGVVMLCCAVVVMRIVLSLPVLTIGQGGSGDDTE